MAYTSEEVHEIVVKALLQSTRRWVPGTGDDPAAFQKARSEFERCLIAPEEGNVEIEPPFASILGRDVGEHKVWFVTEPRAQRVFFDERADKFGVAWGPEVSSGKYLDLGFRTDDPIDAYLA